MSPSGDDPDEAPNGWSSEEASEDVRSWLGADERVICTRHGEGWVAYAEPRGELGTSHQVPLTDGPTDEDGARSAALDYMERNGYEA